ncbi:MAG TPA: MraY family glycosyltransferase [Thermoguttaceae bacterium]|nr:MraY family glycosyltransferase [Thermoguttaceae bacterium]
MSTVQTIIFFLIACVTSLLFTVLIRGVAPRVGLTDRPDGHRKLHEGIMPLGGGIAIFLSFACVSAILLNVPNYFRDVLWDKMGSLMALLMAGAVIVAVGLIDDLVGLDGKKKLLGQIVAVSILMISGLIIEKIGIFGLKLELGVLAIPFTLFWLLGAINALNLLDGIDGLATMIGTILVATIGVIGLMVDRPEVAIIASVFAGSLVGFIRFNFPPASIFLGDTGSMLIGLVVGTLAITGSLKGTGTVLLAAPLAVWAIPIFDSAAAIVRRKLTGRSIYATDRGHLHHRLLYLLGSNRKVLAWLAGACLLTSGAALLSVFLYKTGSPVGDLIAMLTCFAVVIIFIATGVFGKAELLLIGSRLRRVGRSLVLPISSRRGRIRQTIIRLQGSRQWELLWETFTEAADKLSLCEIRLDVNIASAHEEYHASWERPRQDGSRPCWRIELPLMVEDRQVGRLRVAGECHGDSACGNVLQLLDLVEPFESQLVIAEELELLLPDTDHDAAVVEPSELPDQPVLSPERLR